MPRSLPTACSSTRIKSVFHSSILYSSDYLHSHRHRWRPAPALARARSLMRARSTSRTRSRTRALDIASSARTNPHEQACSTHGAHAVRAERANPTPPLHAGQRSSLSTVRIYKAHLETPLVTTQRSTSRSGDLLHVASSASSSQKFAGEQVHDGRAAAARAGRGGGGGIRGVNSCTGAKCMGEPGELSWRRPRIAPPRDSVTPHWCTLAIAQASGDRSVPRAAGLHQPRLSR